MAATAKDIQLLQRKYIESVRLCERVQQRRAALAREMRRCELTLEEIGTEAPRNAGAALYRSVGKAFIMAPYEEVAGELKEEIKHYKEEIAVVERQEAQFKKTAEASQKELMQVMPK